MHDNRQKSPAIPQPPKRIHPIKSRAIPYARNLRSSEKIKTPNPANMVEGCCLLGRAAKKEDSNKTGERERSPVNNSRNIGGGRC